MNTYLFILLGILSYIVFLPLLELIIRYFLGPTKKDKFYYYDEYNRIALYHGVNICSYSKLIHDFLPWHKKEDYEQLKNHGFNIVRFLIFWEAIEPQENKYDNTYLEKIKKHLDIMKELDIKVILDIHQNFYDKKMKNQGFPKWLITKIEKNEAPNKSRIKKITYKNKNFFTAYTRLLSFIQNYFKDEKNIIGIDVLNEPPTFFSLPVYFERNCLSKFYTSIGFEKTKIPLYFEPPIWCSSGIPTNLGEELHIAHKNYIPHYFPPIVHYKNHYKDIDKLLLKFAIRSKAREAQKMKSPYIIGEIGISSKIKNKFAFIKDFIDQADNQYMSWIWWCYDKDTFSKHGLMDSYGKPNNIMESLSRPYPQKVAGTDPFYYNEGEIFYMEFTSNETFKVPTEIYIPGSVIDIETNAINLPYTKDANNKGVILKFYTRIFGKQKIKIKWMSS
jgi:endoglycosylceramidase